MYLDHSVSLVLTAKKCTHEKWLNVYISLHFATSWQGNPSAQGNYLCSIMRYKTYFLMQSEDPVVQSKSLLPK